VCRCPGGSRFSPDGRYLLVQDFEGDWQKADRVRFWEIAARRDRARLEAYFWELEFTGRGSGQISWRWKDGGEVVEVRRWRFTGDEPLLRPAGKFTLAADAVALSPDPTVRCSRTSTRYGTPT
jgi:hypothetical protein